jgi:hypothetical protein
MYSGCMAGEYRFFIIQIRGNEMVNYRSPTASTQDKAQFSVAVYLLRDHVELGERIPLYFTLPTGRSIEGLCDRLRGTASPIPPEVEQTLSNLARRLSVPAPNIVDYDTCLPILKEIALRLTLPFSERHAFLPKADSSNSY